MDRIKKDFGFGCVRLPMLESGEVDKEQTCKMVDTFLENGFNYFDTVHGYLDGKVRSRSKIVFPAAIRERNLSAFGAFSYSSNSAVTINPLGVCSILRTIPFRALILCALG